MLTVSCGVALLAGAAAAQTSEIVSSELQAPSRVRLTPRGNLLVAENGIALHQGRISLVTPSGSLRSVVEGLPSGQSPEGGFSGPTDAVVSGKTLYVLIGVGDVEGTGPTPGTTVPNPKGPSSILLSSLLAFRLPTDVDDIQSPFRMTPDWDLALWDGNVLKVKNETGQEAEVELIVDFRDTVPDPQKIYRGSNPYAIALRGDGSAYIADASLDSILHVDLATGRTRTVKRFPAIGNPTPVGPPRIDPVPNGIVPYGDGYLITFLSGFPFATGNGRIENFHPNTGVSDPFIFGLTMPIDIAVQQTSGNRPRFFVLEFSTNFLAQPPGPGRLLVYDTPESKVLKSDLVTPTSIALDSATGDLYITELATGKLLRVRTTR